VVSETDTLVCFHHPRPEYPIHILLVPKEEIRDLLQFDPENQAFLRDLFTEVFRLVQELSLEQKGYRLILNGGDYQDFPQLHFHLIGGE
jgi:histidine triad (HIT) family protein